MIDGVPAIQSEMQKIIQAFLRVSLEHRDAEPEIMLGSMATVLVAYCKARGVPLERALDGIRASWEIVGARRFH